MPEDKNTTPRSVFDSIPDEVAAVAMRQVDHALSNYFKERYGLIIGTYGVQWVVARYDGQHINLEKFGFTAYTYADCVKWIFEHAEVKV